MAKHSHQFTVSERAQLRRLVAKHGAPRVSDATGIRAHVLPRLLADLDVRDGTAELARLGLAKGRALLEPQTTTSESADSTQPEPPLAA